MIEFDACVNIRIGKKSIDLIFGDGVFCVGVGNGSPICKITLLDKCYNVKDDLSDVDTAGKFSVRLMFKNMESLDVVIQGLMEVRKKMALGEYEKENKLG